MIPNDKVQASLVAFLKSQAPLIAMLSATGDIKETQWQGTEFVYPAIRVVLQQHVPSVVDNDNCNYDNLNFMIDVYTEDASSKNCDIIAGMVNNYLHHQQINQSNVRFFFIRSIGLDHAVRQDTRLWRASVKFKSMIQPI